MGIFGAKKRKNEKPKNRYDFFHGAHLFNLSLAKISLRVNFSIEYNE